MPPYNRLTKAELKELCDGRGIDSASLKTKAELINAIEQYDLRTDALIDENDSVDDDNNVAEVNEGQPGLDDGGQMEGENDVEGSEMSDEERSGDSERVGVRASSRRGIVELDSVATLRLRLALAQEERLAKEREWEIEKERMLMQRECHRSNQRETGAADFKGIKAILPSMNDVDIISFFASFERILELNDVDKSLWAKLLPSQLSPKALRVYARLSLEETKCYDTVKRIILQSYNLDANSYLKSFRTMRRRGQSTYKMFLTSLREMMQRFLDAKNISTFEALMEEYLQEQFLSSLKDNVRQFVISKRPANAAECAEFADLYFEISRIGSERRDFGQHRVQADERSYKPNFGSNRPPPVSNTATAPYKPSGQNIHGHGGKFRPGDRHTRIGLGQSMVVNRIRETSKQTKTAPILLIISISIMRQEFAKMMWS